MRPDHFDNLGKPAYDASTRNLQPVDYLQHRQPPAGSFSTIVNREAEHLAKQPRRQLRPYENLNM